MREFCVMPSINHPTAKSPISLGLIVLALALGASTALAIRGGNSRGPADGPRDQNTCRAGLVWDARKHMCVQAQRGVLPDEELAEYAYALAEEGRYQEALATLDLLQNPDTPRALNYRGFATRKLGRLDEGITYYLKALALDPQYAEVREYLGEAYVVKGRFDLAAQQLAIIESLCGTNCEEYIDLKEAIEQGADL
jgi:tetratricopeptide (TPR) repeat protein